MDRKNLPLVLMLVSGAITCVINLIRNYSMLNQLIVLLVVLVLFYTLGCILRWTLDFFDRQNEQKAAEEGEVIEKEADQVKQDARRDQEDQDTEEEAI